MNYDNSVALLRNRSMANEWTRSMLTQFGLTDYGAWLLVDGSWLDAPLPHDNVGNPHEFMHETGSIRWHSTGDHLNIEMACPPTVDQMRSAAKHMRGTTSVVDLTTLRGPFVRGLGTKLLHKPSGQELVELWRWVEGVFGWR